MMPGHHVKVEVLLEDIKGSRRREGEEVEGLAADLLALSCLFSQPLHHLELENSNF